MKHQPHSLHATIVAVMITMSFYSASATRPPRLSGNVGSAYTGTIQQILTATESDSIGFSRLSYLCDTFGPRLSGSRNLENAEDWILKQMREDQLESVAIEVVQVPHWDRGEESLTMLEPRNSHLTILGLGGSIGTPVTGITAEALVVSSFAELKQRASDARGKIVIYDDPWVSYGENVRYRSRGAIEAARVGAVASLIRSVTPASLQTPHTGQMGYVDSIPKIPHAAITCEDAAMLHRMHDRGQKIVLRLAMDDHNLPDATSGNIIAEIRGREHPEEIVVLGGHIDSWDVGQGAHDDAGGCVAAWEAVRILRRLGLRPRRTIRVVLWTNEENGMRGGLAYAKQHSSEIGNHVFALEADAGVFRPTGFGFTGSDSAFDMLKEIAGLLKPIGADSISKGGGGVDISPLTRSGVPSCGLNVDGTKYFWYHHSPADTIDKIDPSDFRKCTGALAALTYIIADLPKRIAW